MTAKKNDPEVQEEKLGFESLEDLSEFCNDEDRNIAFGEGGVEDLVGRRRTDPATPDQIKMLFALGGKLGLKKEGIKAGYNIESISELTIGEISEIIEQMLEDLDEKKKPDLTAQTESERKLTWRRQSGVFFVGAAFAKCGHCRYFTGENTLTSGKCEKGERKGMYEGTKVYPMTKECFEFKHGPLETQIEETPDSDFDPF